MPEWKSVIIYATPIQEVGPPLPLTIFLDSRRYYNLRYEYSQEAMETALFTARPRAGEILVNTLPITSAEENDD